MAVVEEFGADSELKSLYLVYLGIVLLGGFLSFSTVFKGFWVRRI